ncbi:MAG: M56 family metallopeptidase [Solobacterium sp.]|nr:M56 family metallopeptidase [Solobacterium sp.]
MIGRIFYWIFNMSLVTVLAGTAVLLVRKIRVLPRRFVVFLWVIPLIRMCVPLSLNSPFSVMRALTAFCGRTVPFYQGDLTVSAMNVIAQADGYFPLLFRSVALEKFFAAAGMFWLAGMAAVLMLCAGAYLSVRKEARQARLLRDNIWLSEKAESPFVCGIVHPRIILPASYAEKQIRCILLHENMHIRRKDNLTRLIGFMAAAVHWFDPFVWIFLKCFLADLELACDEAVSEGFSEEQRKEYALALLDGEESRNLLVSAFGGARLRTRIDRILNYRRVTALSAAAFVLVLAVMICTLATNG